VIRAGGTTGSPGVRGGGPRWLSEVAWLLAQWHPRSNTDLNPLKVRAGSNKRVWWQCERGHEWQAIVQSRVRRGSGCPTCANQPSATTNLAVTHPHIAAEWHPTRNGELTAAAVAPRTDRRVWWQCNQGHEWRTSVSNRAGQNTRCPVCAGKRPSAINNLGVAHPEIAAQWHPTRNGELTPGQVTPNSNRRAWWLCEQGHEWDAVIGSRGRCGCPFCANRCVTTETSLAGLASEIAAQWHPTRNGELTPDSVSTGSGRRVWWRCPVCAHDWRATPSERVTRGSGCQVCAWANNRKTYIPLTVSYPAVAAQWHPVANGEARPEEVTHGSNRRVWWQCDRGHAWRTGVNHRTRGSRCPYCAGKKPSAEHNLAVVRPELAAQWHPTRNGELAPEDVTPWSQAVNAWWQCPDCAHEWCTRVAARSHGGGCPICGRPQRKPDGEHAPPRP